MVYTLVRVYYIMGIVLYKSIEMSFDLESLKKTKRELELKTFRNGKIVYKYGYLIFKYEG